MLSDLIKEQMFEEVSSDMNNVDVNECIDILDSILEYECDLDELQGIKKRYSNAIINTFSPESSHERVIESISTLFKVEPIFKLMLFLIDEELYANVAKEKSGFYSVIKLLKLNPKNIDLTKQNFNTKIDGEYIEQIAITYNIRNIEAHTCESWNRKELYKNINAVLVSILYCISINKKMLMKKLGEKNDVSIDVSEYMREIISYFKAKMEKYIMLNGEENLSIINRYISENMEDEREEQYGRMGTIDELRQTGIPERCMIIWGEAGTGKSTTLEYLAYIDAKKRENDKNEQIPVLIPMGLLVSKDISIKQYIANKLKLQCKTVEKLLDEGKINLFLDGINEIPNDCYNQLRSIRLREVRELLDEYSRCFYIISNRPNEHVDFDKVPIFNLLKLSDNQIELFLQKNAENDGTIKVIKDAMDQNERLKDVVRTPLMFSRLIDIVDVTGKVPNSEGAIIGAFLDTLLSREKIEKLDANFDVKKAQYILRAIAYNGLEETSTNAGMTEEVVLSYMQKCMNTYSFSIDSFYMLDMMVQLGILVRREALYLFMHQAYQDYYHALEEIAILGI